MSFGIEIKNNDGDIVIDGKYQNHVIAESGSIIGTGLKTVSFGSSYAPARQPLLFARNTAGYVGLLGWTFSGGNINGFDCAVKDGGPTDWKLAVTPGGPSSETQGLRVFDAAGAVVFDSGLNYLKLIDALLLDYTGLPSGNVSHASGATPFYCLTSAYSRAMRQNTAETSLDLIAAFKAVNGTTVARTWFGFRQVGGVVNWGPHPVSATLLVMDAG